MANYRAAEASSLTGKSAYPLKGQEIAQLISQAAEGSRKIIAGSRVRLPAKFQNDDPGILFLDLKDCTEVHEYSPQDQVISVGCGIQLSQLNDFLKQKQQWFPVSYGSESCTLLDAIIYGECGFLEHLYGGPRRLVLGMTAALSNGDLIRMGGKVVKNVSGYDLTRLFIGSLGTFGIPVSANLRLFAHPQVSCTIALFHEQATYLLEKAREIMMLGIPLSCLILVDLKLIQNQDIQSQSQKICQFEPLERFALLMRICEHSQVVEELKKDLLLFTETISGVKYTIFQDEDFQIWANLYDFKNTHWYPKVDIDVPYKIVHSWWQDGNFMELPFIHSPGLGRLTFFPSRFNEQQRLLEQLAAYAERDMQPLVVTFVDESFIRKTKHFATDTSMQAQLFHSLKQRFDPHGCLNPLVEMY